MLIWLPTKVYWWTLRSSILDWRLFLNWPPDQTLAWAVLLPINSSSWLGRVIFIRFFSLDRGQQKGYCDGRVYNQINIIPHVIVFTPSESRFQPHPQLHPTHFTGCPSGRGNRLRDHISLADRTWSVGIIRPVLPSAGHQPATARDQ